MNSQLFPVFCKIASLTITWDVFEYDYKTKKQASQPGLTITWDVFEYEEGRFKTMIIKFNYNMGCI